MEKINTFTTHDHFFIIFIFSDISFEATIFALYLILESFLEKFSGKIPVYQELRYPVLKIFLNLFSSLYQMRQSVAYEETRDFIIRQLKLTWIKWFANLNIFKNILFPAFYISNALVCLCLCLDLGLFMSYLCDLFFIFSLIFIVINHITSFKQTYFFVHFLEHLLFLDGNVDEESE